MPPIQGYAAAIFGSRDQGAGFKPVKPILRQPPPPKGESQSAVCPPGFTAALVGPGQYECVPEGVPTGLHFV